MPKPAKKVKVETEESKKTVVNKSEATKTQKEEVDDSKPKFSGVDECLGHIQKTDPSNHSEFLACFTDMAHYLLNHTALYIKSNRFQICEIEFYWNGKGHNDIFAHGNEDQLKGKTWYFHRSGVLSSNSYKSGTYKGLDIAIGSGKSYGGILLRSLCEEKTQKFIEGSCMVANEILSVTGHSEIADLVKSFDCSVVKKDDESPLYIEPHTWKTKLPIYQTPRVGLTLKKTDNFDDRKYFIMKPYRYCILPEKISKGKQYLIPALYLAGYDREQIMAIAKSSEKTVNAACDSVDSGKKSKPDKWKGAALKTTDVAGLIGATASLLQEDN